LRSLNFRATIPDYETVFDRLVSPIVSSASPGSARKVRAKDADRVRGGQEFERTSNAGRSSGQAFLRGGQAKRLN